VPNAHGVSLHAAGAWRADQLQNWSSSAATSPGPAIANKRLKTQSCRQVVLQVKSPYKDGTSVVDPR